MRHGAPAAPGGAAKEDFPEIIALHHAQVWHHIRRRVHDAGTVKDLVQSTIDTLYEQLLKSGGARNLETLLYTIADGKLLNHLRKVKRCPMSLGLPSSSSERGSPWFRPRRRRSRILRR